MIRIIRGDIERNQYGYSNGKWRVCSMCCNEIMCTVKVSELERTYMRRINTERMSDKVETPHPRRRLPAFVEEFNKAIVLLLILYHYQFN